MLCRVVHLDLKSSNVLLAADGTAKISDVGLSAQMDHSHISSMPVAGTWAWLAPEVILRGATETQHVTDVIMQWCYQCLFRLCCWQFPVSPAGSTPSGWSENRSNSVSGPATNGPSMIHGHV